ncbi:MAG TPA: hypothetical protein VGO78_00560 [Acidimicrobiales bacterium]|nr:hypothetical protein [Acidimicrobiales bacterium]
MAGERVGDLLDVEDVMGKRRIDTRLLPSVTVREENAVAALEVMSRFAIDPRWLVYLPPTMAPTATSGQPGLLEHPAEAFAAFRDDGVERVICEEKHMGSRAVVVVCRDADVAQRRFGIAGTGTGAAAGVVHTRTGRPFFPARTGDEAALLDRVRGAVDRAGLWDELATDWLVLDAELMPWSAKALDLLRAQYAPVAAAGLASTGAAAEALAAAVARGVDIAPVHERLVARQQDLADYTEAYGRYCWPVTSVDDLRLAPFVVLAGEGAVHAARDHEWHMDIAARLAAADAPDGDGDAAGGVLMATDYRVVDLADRFNEAEAIQWWEGLTATGGEGMVVKPADAIVQGGRHGLVQPGIKCRGRDYLRIIYGPEYTEPANLDRLRQRGIGHKRSLAQREFALGIEALERFVAGEPLYRVHECVFGVLALESEPVDPRL